MRKIFYILFLYFLLFLSVSADNELKIISREEWGANSEYIFRDSKEWKQILGNSSFKPSSVSDYEDIQKDSVDGVDAETLKEFKTDIKVEKTIKSIGGRELVWPIEIVNKKNAIVIHHTAGEYKSSLEGIRAVYKYHSLSRGWGDIGYNFVIGYDGEIFEGRSGGDKAVGAHTLLNNKSAIGISVLGDYSNKTVNKKQYDSILNLVSYLVDKNDIDLSKKVDFFRECIGNNCYSNVELIPDYPIIGHRDAGHTSCPGELLYKDINSIFHTLAKKQLGLFEYSKLKFYTKFDAIKKSKLITTLYDLEEKIDLDKSISSINIKKYLLPYLNTEYKTVERNKKDEYVNVKLDYTNSGSIDVKIGDRTHNIGVSEESLFFNGVLRSVVFLDSGDNDYFEISSFYNYNDIYDQKNIKTNKYRGQFIAYLKEGELTIINRVTIEDYLKGVLYKQSGENDELNKTLVYLARSDAKYKMEQKGDKIYDIIDLGDDFFSYVGYEIEQYNQNFIKLIDETKGLYITSEGKNINPLYHISSNGKTVSYYDLCRTKKSIYTCSKLQKNYPYLVGVDDNGGNNKETTGFGLGVPLSGIDYLSSRGWSAELILHYFYNEIKIQ